MALKCGIVTQVVVFILLLDSTREHSAWRLPSGNVLFESLGEKWNCIKRKNW